MNYITYISGDLSAAWRGRRIGGKTGRPRRAGRAALHLGGGVRRGRRPADRAVRRADVRARAAALRDAGAEAALPAPDVPRRRLLVPGLLGDGRRLGPRRAQDPGALAGRPLRGDGGEDLDDARALRRLDLLPGPQRPRPREAAGGG